MYSLHAHSVSHVIMSAISQMDDAGGILRSLAPFKNHLSLLERMQAICVYTNIAW